jgi:hypothetical protein
MPSKILLWRHFRLPNLTIFACLLAMSWPLDRNTARDTRLSKRHRTLSIGKVRLMFFIFEVTPSPSAKERDELLSSGWRDLGPPRMVDILVRSLPLNAL